MAPNPMYAMRRRESFEALEFILIVPSPGATKTSREISDEAENVAAWRHGRVAIFVREVTRHLPAVRHSDFLPS
jgi:hypothetical protein